MIATTELFHILALEITGPARSSPPDLELSVSIVLELLDNSEACELARSDGNVTVIPGEDRVFALFHGDPGASVRSAFELWEMLHELPSLSVRILLHHGSVALDSGAAVGEGIEEADALLETVPTGQIVFSQAFSKSIGEDGAASPLAFVEQQRLVILETDIPDLLVGQDLESALNRDGHQTLRDAFGAGGVAWAREMELRIRGADAVVVIVSKDSAVNDLLQYQLEIAEDERRKRGRPYVIPVWLTDGQSDADSLAALHRNLHQAVWRGSEDTGKVVEEVRAVLTDGQVEADPKMLESTGGAVPGDSKFYVRRPADEEFEEALSRHESIVLIKGPRQIGKTSLIGRGMRKADEKGWRYAHTDFQKLSSRQLESETSFYRVVASTLARQAGFEFDFDGEWIDALGENMNMDGFMTELLNASDRPLVWFIDEADRLFASPFASDFFGLVRSWHNARATDWRGPWSRFTVVIGYATEAHLFIKDLNQSPFNVGHPIELPSFSLENVIDLNERYGRPLGRAEDTVALHALVGGQPFLTRRALDIVAQGKMTADQLFVEADKEDGPFGDHLKRLLVSVTQLPTVWEALMQSLTSPDLADSDGLYRLVAAGILIRTQRRYELRYELYRRYLTYYFAERRSR